jgi:hypothetical protein
MSVTAKNTKTGILRIGLLFFALITGTGQAADYSYEYDSQGRLTRVDYGTEVALIYSYDPGGNPLGVQVLGAGSSSLVLTGLNPSGAVAGGTAFTLVLNGISFPIDSTAQWNGADRPTIFESSTQLTTSVPASDIAVSGTVSVTVHSQESGGITSNPLVFTIAKPDDAYFSSITLQPARVEGGSASTATVSLNKPAPAGGALVVVSSSGGEASVPPTVQVPEGATTAAFTVSTTAVSSTSAVVITGAYAGLTRTATLVVTPEDQGGEGFTIFVPIVLSAAGLSGSFFTSELTLTNRSTATASLDITYTGAFGAGGGTASDTLPPSTQRVFSDAFAYLKSIGIAIPDLGNRGGTVSIRILGLASPLEAAVTTRTTTAVPEGHVGLSLPGVPWAAGLTGTSYICGLRQNALDRSNVALQNMGGPSDGDVSLVVTVFSGDPVSPLSLTLPEIVLSPGGFSQITEILNSNGLSLTNGYVRIVRKSGSAPYYAYGVINDQKNSDGSFVPPTPETILVGKTGLTVPVMVETAAFSSELVFTNWSTEAKRLRCAYVAEGIAAPQSTASFDVTLRSGEQSIIPNFVQFLRDQAIPGIGPLGSNYAGALFISVDGGDIQGLFAGARTTIPAKEGRYGLFYSGVPDGTAFTSSAWIYGLQQNAETRSNLAIVNTGQANDQPDQFSIDIYDGMTGKKVNTLESLSLGARGWMQIGTILANHAPGTTQGYVRITRTGGANPFIVYGVLNDGSHPGQRTGDGAYVSGSP